MVPYVSGKVRTTTQLQDGYYAVIPHLYYIEHPYDVLVLEGLLGLVLSNNMLQILLS